MSMKKLLTALALLLPLTAMAQHWEEPVLGTYDNETPVFVKVYINGEQATANSGLELAAFIGGTCRADATTTYTDNAAAATVEYDAYWLRVWGSAGDMNQDITFRAYYGGIEYEFTTTITFDGNTHGALSDPIVLNLDAVTGVSLPKIIEINQPAKAFPYKEDLLQYITLEYNTPDGAPYKVLDQSKILSDITYSWSWTGGG